MRILAWITIVINSLLSLYFFVQIFRGKTVSERVSNCISLIIFVLNIAVALSFLGI
ncbi:MAG: hypothetical protein ACRCVJ_12370 [Clostridium sp.]|uniref:hypothetical protein n=1 Tax=Clostridium sp. TaxID=1506 RepID=UPI003F3911CB